MWIQVKTAPNLMIAEMWKEFFEAEGVPTRLLVDPQSPRIGEFGTYQVLVPEEKKHVVEEILRKA